jgi:hypothetical protein
MVDVELISGEAFNNQENELLNDFKAFIQAMISKDKVEMENFLDNSFVLIHMGGNQEPKNHFINDVMEGVLNYYHSKIIEPKIIINNNSAEMNVDINLDAKVYGMKGNWTLHSKNTFIKKNGRWYFVKWGN